MTAQEVFNQEMTQNTNLALASAVDNQPNVRVISFVFDENTPSKVYFSTHAMTAKVKEFSQNEKVAAVLLPDKPNADNSVRFAGTVKKSELSIPEFGKMMVKKLPQMAAMYENANPGEIFIYEINYPTAQVTIGMNPPAILEF